MNKKERHDSDAGPSSYETAGMEKKQKKMKFRKEWYNEFSTWLQEDSGDESKALCAICNVTIGANITALRRHSDTMKHKQNVKSSRQCSVQSTERSQSKEAPILITDECENAKIKMAAFIAEHKLAHQAVDHLYILISEIFKPEMKFKPYEAQTVINNVIGSSEKDRLVNDLKNNKFSVLMDETIDIEEVKTMCIVVQYYDCSQGKVVSCFWDLIQLKFYQTDDSAKAEHLFSLVIKSFENYFIPLDNIIGFALDGHNTMASCRNSVSTQFSKKFPDIKVLKCNSYSLHLCVSDACKKLPPECEKLARAIYNHLKLDCKYQSEIKGFQMFTETEIYKILKPAQTQWLSLETVVNIIWKQWDNLQSYFNNRLLEGIECSDIRKSLQDPIIKVYYCFLNWILPKFTKSITFFQSETTEIFNMYKELAELYEELLTTFMDPSYVKCTKLSNINPTTNTDHYLNLDGLYLGRAVYQQLELPVFSNKPKLVQELKINCRKFIITACEGIRESYSLNDPVFSAFFKLRPVWCLSTSNKRLLTLSSFFNMLPRISPKTTDDQQQLDDEWRNFPTITKLINIQDTTEKVELFWHKISELKQIDGQFKFKILPKFMLNVLSLPHFNAECEQIFSQVNNIKTKERNKTEIETIKGNILAQQSIKRNGGTCVDFVPTEDMINKMNATI